MFLLGSWKKGRRNFLLIWTWMIAVVAATRTVVEASESLHPSSKVCTNKTTILQCDVTDNTKQYRLEDFKWESFRKVIITNASHLILEEPLCSNQTTEVLVFNSDRVTAAQGTKNCWQQLSLYYSRDVTIEDGINLVQMFSSEARKIILPLGSIHLEDSQVEEASLSIDIGISTIINSTIHVVNGLMVKKSMVLSMEDSTLGRLEGFIYNSSEKTEFNNVTVNYVAFRGLVMHSGVLKLVNTFIKRVTSVGVLVVQGAELILQDCEIESIAYDSILVSDGGKITFSNVTIGQHRENFFVIKDVTGLLYPLAFLGNQSISPSGWVGIAVFVGVIVGVLGGVAVMVVVERHLKTSSFKMGTSNNTQHTTSKSASSSHAYIPIDKFITTPPTRSPAKADKEQLVKDQQGPPIELAPMIRWQRPPAALPPERSALTVKPQNMSNPNTAIDYLNKKEKDERDVLPLPPPPPPLAEDEELYDDVQGSAGQGRNVFP